MIKIGVCRHFLHRVENASVRRDGHQRRPKASHARPARPLAPNACFGRVKKKWGESGMIKIGVCRHFLQRPENAAGEPGSA